MTTVVCEQAAVATILFFIQSALTGGKNVGIVHIENGCRPVQTMLEILAVIKNREGHEAHQPISMPQAL